MLLAIILTVFAACAVHASESQDVTELKRLVDRLIDDNRKLRQILEISQQTNEKKIAFYANIPAEDYYVVEDSIAVFDVVETNVGNGYNPGSGAFTAFTPGVYVFNLFFQTVDGHNSDMSIFVNDQPVCAGDAHDDWDQGGCTAIVELDVGDAVNVKARDGDAWLHGSQGGQCTGFSGFLYQEL